MTISDIAKLAGVSVATVSRVLNNKGYVKAETRKRIEEVIAQKGYHPNAVARSLILNDTGMLAVIMSNRMNPFFSGVLEAVEHQAELRGYSLLFYNTGEDRDRELRAVTQAIEHRVRGILILPVIGSNPQTRVMLSEAEKRGIPVVLMDREIPSASFDIVTIDNREAVYQGVRLLLEAGHREIGLITCPECVKRGMGRLDGYIKCLREHGLPLRETYIYRGEFDEKSGYEACRKFFSLPNPPSAVLATCSSATLGCLRYLNERRLTPGEDIGLVGFDDISLLSSLGYQITMLDRPIREMGEAAFAILEQRLTGGGGGRRKRKVLLDTRVILRGSEGRVPAQALPC